MPSPTNLQTRQPDLDVAFYLRIEGIGDVTGSPETTRTLYVFTRATDWTASASQRFIRGLQIPASFTDGADALGGVGDSQGLSFELMEFDDASNSGRKYWADMFGTERWSTAPGTWPQTYLAAPLNRTATSAQVETTSGFNAAGGVLYIGNECITYTGVDVGPTRFTGLTRGLHPVSGSNFAHTHRINADNGAALPVLVTTRPYSFYGREVSLYAVHRFPDGRWETEGNAMRLWTGRIRRLDWAPTKNAWVLGCDSILADLERQVFSLPRAQTRIVGLNLGGESVLRKITIRHDFASADEIEPVAIAQFFPSIPELIEDLNASIQTAYGSGAGPAAPEFAYAADGDVSLDEGEITIPRGTVYLHGMTSGTIQRITLMPGLALALGWDAEVTTFESLNSPFTVVAPGPAPAACFYATPNSDGTMLIYVENTTGFLTTGQGGFQNGAGAELSWVLLGNRYLLGVSGAGASALGVPPTLNGTATLPSPMLAEYSSIHESIAARWDAEGQPMPNGRNGSGDVEHDKIEQVFIASAGDLLWTFGVLRFMQRVAVSTGTPGYNDASLDMYAEGCGIGLRAADIDMTAWGALNDELLAEGAARWRIFTAPTPFSEWLKEEGRTLGISWVMANGLITPRRTPGLALSASASYSLLQGDLAGEDERPATTESPGTIVNAAVLHSHWLTYGGGQDGFRDHSPILSDVESQDRFGVVRSLEIKNKGLLGATDLPALLGMIGARALLFSRPIPIARMRLSRRWWGRIAPLDVFTFTNPSLPDRNAGVIGVTSKIAMIKSVTHNLRDATVTIEFFVFPMQRQAPLCPSALLDYNRGDAGWDAGNNRVYCLAHEFSAAGAAVDVSYFSAGDAILICEDGSATPNAPQLWRRTVSSVTAGSNYITIGGGALAGFNTALRYFVTFDVYSSVTADQRTRGTFIAGAGTSRITGTTDWYPYT